MKHNFFLLFAFILSIFFISCEKEDFSGNNKIKFERFYFEYNEKSYVLNYYFKKDSSIVYEDTNTASLYQKITKIPQLSILIKNDSTAAFFNTNKDLIEYLKDKSEPNEPILKNIPFPLAGVRVIFYKDKNYKGETLIYEEARDTYIPVMPNGWDNKISSFKFQPVGARGCLNLYTEKDGRGWSISYEIKRNQNVSVDGLFSNINEPNLSLVLKGFLQGSYNDDISSFNFIIFRD